jgi:hypothetical protein
LSPRHSLRLLIGLSETLEVKPGSSLFILLSVLVLAQFGAGWLLTSRAVREHETVGQFELFQKERSRLERVWGEKLQTFERLASEKSLPDRVRLAGVESVRTFRLTGEWNPNGELVEVREPAVQPEALQEADPYWPEAIRERLRERLSKRLAARGASAGFPEILTFAWVLGGSAPSETLQRLTELASSGGSERLRIRLWTSRFEEAEGADSVPRLRVVQGTFEYEPQGFPVVSAAQRSPGLPHRGRSLQAAQLRILGSEGSRPVLAWVMPEGFPAEGDRPSGRAFSRGGRERLFWSWFAASGGLLLLAVGGALVMGREASVPLRRLVAEIEKMDPADPATLLRLSGETPPAFGTTSSLSLLVTRLRVLFEDLIAERERWIEQNAERFAGIERENAALRLERDALRTANEQGLALIASGAVPLRPQGNSEAKAPEAEGTPAETPEWTDEKKAA